jgi:long-chain acyl-CoA synthetase
VSKSALIQSGWRITLALTHYPKYGLQQHNDSLKFRHLEDPHAKPEVVITYAQMYQQIQQFAAGLQALGVQPGERVALIADNSPRWMIADQGIMASGAVDVVRSAQAEREELLFILADSGSTALVVEDIKTLKKLRESYQLIW